LLLISPMVAAHAEEDSFNLRAEQERLVDLWQLVEKFCGDQAASTSDSLRHPQARVSMNLAQASCTDAYKKLRELDDGADKESPAG